MNLQVKSENYIRYLISATDADCNNALYRHATELRSDIHATYSCGNSQLASGHSSRQPSETSIS